MGRLIALVVSVFLVTVQWRVARADDQALKTLSTLVEKQRAAPPCPVLLTAESSQRPGALALQFTLTNVSPNTIVIGAGDLPWDGPYGITFAALDAKGMPLDVGYPIYDQFGPPPKFAIAPQQTLRGTYDLLWRLDPGGVPPNAKLTVVWAYLLRIMGIPANRQPLCTGITFMLTPKKVQ